MREKILSLDMQKTMFWALMSVFVLCVGFYIYSINVTIRNVVVRQNLESEISRLALENGSQEFRYISMRNEITLPLAYSLGFKDVSDKTFISRQAVHYVSYVSKEI